ncbi:MAG: putative Ig domain-containing protein [Blastocatellia bacterium]
MKHRILLLVILTSLVLSGWPLYHSHASSSKTGAGQQVGEPFRVPAIAAAGTHSLALRSDGTVVGWGDNGNGQRTIPSGLSGVVALAAGYHHSLALKSDGTVVGWGRNFEGQSTIPSGLSGVVAIAGGGAHSLALKSDGTVVAWGVNFFGQSTIPSGLSGVVAIAASFGHSLALKSDGTVVAWGRTTRGQTTIPSGLSGVTAIAAGNFHSLALMSDGTVVAWGDSTVLATIPSGLSGVTAIAAGNFHSLALSVVNNTPPTITAASVTRTAGSPTSNTQIATVSDAEDNENILNVTATPVSGSGVPLSNLSTDTSGNVTADVTVTCAATTSTFTLQVTDNGTLSATATLTITVNPDATPPDTNLLSTPPGITDGNATFSFTGMDNCSSVVTFECQLDATGWSACTNPQMYTNLAGGSHTFQVRAKDALGNVDATPASYTWTVFTSSCSTVVNPILLPTATRGTPFVQTLSASPTGSYVFSLASGTLPPGVNLVNTLGIYSSRGTPTTAGTYTFTIKAAKANSTCAGARTYMMVIP